MSTETANDIHALIESMQAIEARLIYEGDPRRYFHSTYLRTTRAVAAEITRDGFADSRWVQRWDVAFAGLYLQAFDRFDRTGKTVAPWQIAFTAAADHELPPLRHILLGMNAHINYDLPQALCDVISPKEFEDTRIVARRAADHRHIDDVLASRVADEDIELRKVELPGQRTLLDRLLQPFNRLGTKRFLRESRTKVWANARVLDGARRQGVDDHVAALRVLEELSSRKVAELAAPGQVILRLARNGFGVELPATGVAVR